MPAGNKTGPQGMGPRTGRGAGYCAGYDRPGFANQGFGGGFGRGFGRGMFGRRAFGGRGFRNWFRATGQPGYMGYGAYPGAYQPAAPAPMTPEQEQDALKAQEAWLQEQLDAVRGQLNKEQDKE
jgi:hypothetical protein